jgi:hypothetical protein
MFQTSTPIALHGLEDLAVFGNRPLPDYGPDYICAMQRIWGNYIKTGNASGTSILDTFLGLDDWPEYSFSNPAMFNVNQTGGTLELINKTLNAAFKDIDAMWSIGSGLRNDFGIVRLLAQRRSEGANVSRQHSRLLFISSLFGILAQVCARSRTNSCTARRQHVHHLPWPQQQEQHNDSTYQDFDLESPALVRPARRM